MHKKLKFFAACKHFDIEDHIENIFTKIDALLHFAKGGKILIATESNSQSTT
jgi:hypothetical protein